MASNRNKETMMMKMILAVLLIPFLQANAAVTEGEVQCSSASVSNIVLLSSSGITARSLSSAEKAALENDIDDQFDCNEGVGLRGPRKEGGKFVYDAICWADSLGSSYVSLELSCK